jgi:hypothetical protein
MIKIVRIQQFFEVLNTSNFMKMVKSFYLQRAESIIINDPDVALDMLLDHNKIHHQIQIKYLFNTFKLICMIFMSSYFLGQFFHIWCEITSELVSYPYHFMDYYNLETKNSFEQTLTMTYYAFTSLSTVGFGDYAPRSNPERIFIALILLFGVAIFSLIMGIFIDILNEFNAFYRDDFDDGDNLTRFFGIFRRFNGD